ncbi:hypothetical protein CRE_17652 [Caenorhabditis remanei]|uniref:BTB domain-containing protein n=1 Tax=Caenorhabditis remanei TaxID=31234 RepID=E3NMF0_CAERE|nr:hypothetical protein CRE_17652 [Caenorhabditis remanei]
MLGDPIEYRSGRYSGCNYIDELVLEPNLLNKGIKCIWSKTLLSPRRTIYKWKFDWSELEGVDKLTGHITVSSLYNAFTAKKMNVELTENNKEFTKEFNSNYTVSYKYSLTPHYTDVSKAPLYKEMFAASKQNDTILVVEGKKLHVNKTFLSSHSEYFRALFSSNFKKGQMDEIPIGDVSFKDFALLLSTFYPNQVFPNDSTVEKLLELARRFLVSSAIKVAEHHLLEMSKIDNQKMLFLADEYGMPKLLKKCIRGLDNLAKVKETKQSEKYDQLSDKTKVKVYDRLMDFI